MADYLLLRSIRLYMEYVFKVQTPTQWSTIAVAKTGIHLGDKGGDSGRKVPHSVRLFVDIGSTSFYRVERAPTLPECKQPRHLPHLKQVSYTIRICSPGT